MQTRWEDDHLFLNFSKCRHLQSESSMLQFSWKDDGLSVAIRDALHDDRAETLMHHLISAQLLQNAFVNFLDFDVKHCHFLEFVRGGFDINLMVEGDTYLNKQILSLSESEIEEMLDMGADVNLGKTPVLHAAINDGKGANVNGVDEHGMTILATLLQHLRKKDWVRMHRKRLKTLNHILEYEGIDVQSSWNLTKQKWPDIDKIIPSASHLRHWISKTASYLDILVLDSKIEIKLDDGDWNDRAPAWFESGLDQFDKNLSEMSPKKVLKLKNKIENLKRDETLSHLQELLQNKFKFSD
eukprot:TRINITY_DN8570_c0_g5_i4.p1 TRINITY_DN8570_c0_g5~~TRINITY_DN8570_c0_g5_i4.p1  ORF type:complete len:298 (+),score=99.80 TRINITY_DN8570_c0_g5_i4:621-1514(+)